VAGNSIYVAATDAHTVYALDCSTGKQKWQYVANGRIDTPPTYYENLILFGTRSGYVYALRATDGALAWRFRAAPEERLIGAFDQLESAWPVYGSVLVKSDTAYFTAGRSSHLDGGIHIYGLEPSTGKVLHQTLREGPEPDISDPGWHSNKTGDGFRADVLQAAGANIYMRQECFDAQLNPGEEVKRIHVKGGFLDDTYFQRIYCAYGLYADTYYDQFSIKDEKKDSDNSAFYNSRGLSQILINDEKYMYGTRMYDHMKLLNDWNFFTPADKGYLVFATNRETQEPAWAIRLPIRVNAMAVSTRALVVAGEPDIVDERDPLGAFEGRKGGVLNVVSADAGKKLAEIKLDSPPVFNGIAVANDKLFIAGKDGTIIAVGEK
jgi:hypothetical protein